MKGIARYLAGLLSVITILALWKAIAWLGQYPSFILPHPEEVARRFWLAIADGSLLFHAKVTLLEIGAGLSLGLFSAFILGYLLAKIPFLEFYLTPLVVVSQSMPVVALAPLLVIWFGFGLASKIAVCALTVFFPVLVGTIVGLRSVEQEFYDLMRILRASRWQVFWLLELPAALPILMGSIKVGVTLSVIGAVVGEFVAADRGLGFLVNLARGLFDTPLLFVALSSLAAIAIALYLGVALLEKKLMRWR